MNASHCRPHRQNKPHAFHADSGWCIHGCGVRDDGAVMNMRSGEFIHTPTINWKADRR